MTFDELNDELRPLRLHGACVIAHSSLSAFGDVDGGATAVCRTLMEAVSGAGTLLMPTFTYAETLPGTGTLQGRPVAYHPDLPVSREIGAIAEAFRRMPGVVRSGHPTHSFAAWGRRTREILSTQRDNNLLGPLKKLNLMQGDVLLLGTSLHSATVLHLAEELAGVPYLERRTAARINASGHEERVVLEKVPGCSLAFDRLEPLLDSSRFLGVPLARGHARRLPVRYLLGVGMMALEHQPDAFLCGRAECDSCRRKEQALAAVA